MFDSSMFFFFMFLLYFYDFVQKNGPGRESNKHTLLCNQSKSASEPVNNFYIFYKQLNIYFTNVWHPQENNSRSATAHPFFVSLQEIYKKFNSIILFFYLAHYWQVMFHLSCFKLYFYRQNDEPLLCEFAVKILARLDIIPGSTTA